MSTKEKFSNLAEDLKTSWYFRIWFILWLAGFLATFSALIILGKRADTAMAHESWRTWFERDTKIEYPSFA